MKQLTSNKVGVIGAQGDLGAQLVVMLRAQNCNVIEVDTTLGCLRATRSIIGVCHFVHICAPLSALGDVMSVPDGTIVVLHDSVMSSSRLASLDRLGGRAAIVHMLMNRQSTVIIAEDEPHHDEVASHMQLIGLQPKYMSVDEHDLLMARSQAPLALMSAVLLPYLYQQRDLGMLTPSGALLVETLHARALVWTPETVRSILRNPQLKVLIDDMQSIVGRVEQA